MPEGELAHPSRVEMGEAAPSGDRRRVVGADVVQVQTRSMRGVSSHSAPPQLSTQVLQHRLPPSCLRAAMRTTGKTGHLHRLIAAGHR